MRLPRMITAAPDATPAQFRARFSGGASSAVVPAEYRMSMQAWSRYTDCLGDGGQAYDCPAGRNDCFIYGNNVANGLQNFHVHEFSHLEGETMRFTSLLPKNGAFRDGNEPDLANLPLNQWAGAVQNMNQSVRTTVAAIKACFEAVGALRV